MVMLLRAEGGKMKDPIRTMNLFCMMFLGKTFKSTVNIAFEATQLTDNELDEKIKQCIENEDMQTGRILLAEFANRSLKQDSPQ